MPTRPEGLQHQVSRKSACSMVIAWRACRSTLAKSPKPASLHANRHAPLTAPPVTAHPWKPHQSQNPPSFQRTALKKSEGRALEGRWVLWLVGFSGMRSDRWGRQGCVAIGMEWCRFGRLCQGWATSTSSDDHGTHQLTTNPARDPSISAGWAGSWADQWSIKRLRVWASRVEESQCLPAVRLFLTKLFIHSLLTLRCPIHSQALRTMNVKITWKAIVYVSN